MSYMSFISVMHRHFFAIVLSSAYYKGQVIKDIYSYVSKKIFSV
jgi:hypothetical protein